MTRQKGIKLSIVYSIIYSLSLVGFSQSFKVVQCTENNPAIRYAHIQNLSNGQKTLSNADGEFALDRVTETDRVRISHIGFYTVEISASDILKSGSICLESQFFELSEVLVGTMTEFQFLQKGIQNTEAKIQNPSKLEAYYKEFVSSNGEYSHFSDGAITYFIKKSGNEVQIDGEVKESRAFELPKPEELSIDLISPIGYKKGMEFFFPSNIKRFMSADSEKNYSYELSETQDEWVIRASPLENSEAISSGYASFHKSDTTLSRVSITIDKNRLHLVKKLSLLGYTVKIEGFDLDILYLKTEKDVIYPTLIRLDYKTNVSNKKALDQSNSFVSDLQITKLLEDQNPIPKRQRYNKKSLYKRGTDFHTEYWLNKSVFNLTQGELDVIKRFKK